MRVSLLQALVVVSGLAGCSLSASRSGSGPGRERLDVLTSYTLALSKRDYVEAARFLAPADRAKLADPAGGILPEYRERVRAVRRTTLVNNPLIEVRNGLIYGIPDVLPVLALGQPDTVAAAETAYADAAPAGPDTTAAANERRELRRTSEAFFRAVSKRDWRKAMDYVAEQERKDFLDDKGALRAQARTRLAAADTSEWEALTLMDGKLTGVVLILPETASR
jgi:hypothetical protein